MSFNKKTINYMVLALVIVGVGCGEHMPVARSHSVADKGYLLSFTRINLTEGESRYHFQLCRRQAISNMEADTSIGEQACFNPFEDVEGEPLVFAALPATDGLWIEGMTGRTLRYTAGTAVVLVFGALAFVLIPKAAKLAFTKVLQLRKASLSGEADEVIEHIAKTRADKAQQKALKKGEDFDYRQHYEQVLQKKKASFSIFKTKPALFFTSLFIAGGTLRSWQFSYEAWRDASKQLEAWGWGERELELAEAYPFLARGAESEPYHIASVKRLLETLRDHQQLIFSVAYLREFPPPAKDATDRGILNKNF